MKATGCQAGYVLKRSAGNASWVCAADGDRLEQGVAEIGNLSASAHLEAREDTVPSARLGLYELAGASAAPQIWSEWTVDPALDTSEFLVQTLPPGETDPTTAFVVHGATGEVEIGGSTPDVEARLTVNGSVAVGAGVGTTGFAGGSDNSLKVHGRSDDGETAAAVQLGDNASGTSRQFAMVNGHNGLDPLPGHLLFLASSGANKDPLDPTDEGAPIMSLKRTGVVGLGALASDECAVNVAGHVCERWIDSKGAEQQVVAHLWASHAAALAMCHAQDSDGTVDVALLGDHETGNAGCDRVLDGLSCCSAVGRMSLAKGTTDGSGVAWYDCANDKLSRNGGNSSDGGRVHVPFACCQKTSSPCSP